MTLAALLAVAGLHLLAAVSPGPAFLVLVRTAVSEGFRPAVGLSVGLGLGAVCWAFAALAGLAVLFAVAPALLTAFKVAGAGFLLWLAWKTIAHANDPLPGQDDARAPRTLFGAIRLGVVTQLANPKPAIFFGAVFIGLLPPDAGPALWALLLAIIFCNETLWYILVARLFSTGKARDLYQGFKRHIDRCFGGLIAALGVKIALS